MKNIDLLILDLLSVVWTSFYFKCGKKSFPFIQIFFYIYVHSMQILSSVCAQSFFRLLRLRLLYLSKINNRHPSIFRRHINVYKSYIYRMKIPINSDNFFFYHISYNDKNNK